MNWLEAFVLGIIQGLTEFLPVSSTGHLYLGRHFFGLDEAGLFLDTMLHIGTLIALLIFYKDEIIAIIKKPFSKLTYHLIVGTIPAVIAGLLFKDFFEEISKTGVTVGWEFLVTGFFLWFAEKFKKGSKKIDQIGYKDALFMGVFQAGAIFPAVSRSGLTIVAALMRRLDRETAAYFSFLLSIPAIFGAILLQSVDLLKGTVEQVSLISIIVAVIASGISGYMAIKWMIGFLKRRSLKVFSVYVCCLGVIILLGQSTGIM